MLFCVCAAALLGLMWLMLEGMSGEDVDDILSELYALPATATASDLERLGYVDLTEIQPGRLEDVSSYFVSTALPLGMKPVDRKRPLLKTFVSTGDGLFVHVFDCDESAALAAMVVSYNVKTQRSDGSPRTFRLQREEVKAQNGVVEVWLRAHTPDVLAPDGDDFLLYQYQEP
ncbi:MAG: hypothetical protein Q4F17_10660 [Eubacteriales bacterium]|nr:hypothetical protein [Eubacteriales bacterium]